MGDVTAPPLVRHLFDTWHQQKVTNESSVTAAVALDSLAAVPSLVRPTPLVRESFLEAARDLRDEGWLPDFPVAEVAADFGGHLLDGV